LKQTNNHSKQAKQAKQRKQKKRIPFSIKYKKLPNTKALLKAN
jgi:hypothetical protein